ncbi:hypothetical protein DFP72DRAFT_894720 [Ephemerocybe angulata]|uniref:Uncharacterized protein n=1 Tax=Ephemerocybe angulata TaxID=980116 RepID=A0A8H6HZJ1_9AGAR|nr:hypothetical protein DFP72DRAFT_894720 [Tulosesus angulatus]
MQRSAELDEEVGTDRLPSMLSIMDLFPGGGRGWSVYLGSPQGIWVAQMNIDDRGHQHQHECELEREHDDSAYTTAQLQDRDDDANSPICLSESPIFTSSTLPPTEDVHQLEPTAHCYTDDNHPSRPTRTRNRTAPPVPPSPPALPAAFTSSTRTRRRGRGHGATTSTSSTLQSIVDWWVEKTSL